MKMFSLLGAGLVLTLLLFSGCAETTDSSTQTASSEQDVQEAQDPTFASVSFRLPGWINWTQTRSEPTAGGGIAEWIPEGSTAENSPFRVVFQKRQPGISPEARLQQILAPIRECADVRVNRFNGKSRYGYQANVEVFCSKMGKNNWGLISYVAVFSNRRESDVLIGEIRTVATEKAGIFPVRNEQEKKTVAEIQQLSKALFNMVSSVQVCADDGTCR
ncbi:MAG: hypothetical protein CSB32_01155 [Desulfobacterales bacterium]|nr:MAG: hypothetical protein CSB32_01155 [Desulfobacterales bacterium]